MTAYNTILLGAATAFISLGVATVQENWVAGCVEFALGVIAIVIYEKLPPSTT